MRRLTIRLPDLLHRRLIHDAEREGVSLNDHVVGLLSLAVDEDRATFESLVSRCADEAADAALQEVLSARTEI